MAGEALLGFDAREVAAGVADLWGECRTDRFLLRLDVVSPLSVDPMVWPSVFDTGEGIGLPAAERRRLHLAGLPVPGWIGPSGSLWESLPRLRQYLAENAATVPPHLVVAVSWLSDRDFADAGPFGPHPAETEPSAVDSAWRLLGYDVADGSCLSGLANCGYAVEEARGLRATWAGLLNASHLFDRAADAFRFKEVADARVTEHAPFFIYGLYEVAA